MIYICHCHRALMGQWRWWAPLPPRHARPMALPCSMPSLLALAPPPPPSPRPASPPVPPRPHARLLPSARGFWSGCCSSPVGLQSTPAATHADRGGRRSAVRCLLLARIKRRAVSTLHKQNLIKTPHAASHAKNERINLFVMLQYGRK